MAAPQAQARTVPVRNSLANGAVVQHVLDVQGPPGVPTQLSHPDMLLTVFYNAPERVDEHLLWTAANLRPDQHAALVGGYAGFCSRTCGFLKHRVAQQQLLQTTGSCEL